MKIYLIFSVFFDYNKIEKLVHVSSTPEKAKEYASKYDDPIFYENDTQEIEDSWDYGSSYIYIKEYIIDQEEEK